MTKDRGKPGVGKHMQSGHIQIYKDGKYQYEHIVNMEKKLGRKLRPGEQVHHKNGQASDNRPKNLQIVTMASHNTIDQAHHNGGRKVGT